MAPPIRYSVLPLEPELDFEDLHVVRETPYLGNGVHPRAVILKPYA